jgi:small subunit ribosomal protein S3
MAVDARKVLASAIANAENNHNLDVDALVVPGGFGRQVDRHEALRDPRPRQVHPHPEAVQPPPHRRPRAGRSIMGHKAIRSACACRSTAPGTAAGSRKGRTMAACCSRISRSVSTSSRRCPQAAISKVVIERPAKLCRISIYAARPGVIIGKKGADIEKLRKKLGKMTGLGREPEHRRDPQAGNRRQARRPGRRRSARAPYRLPSRHEACGSVGAASRCRGHPDHLRRPSRRRRDRATEWYREGRVPLHTLRGNVDYAEAEAHTAYGVCGVKVWIFKGEILGHDPMAQDRLMMEAQTSASVRRAIIA